MTDYGPTDTSTTSLASNQFPVSAVWVPNDALRPVGGSTKLTDSGGKAYTAALVSVVNANPNGATAGVNSSPVVTAIDDINLSPGTQGWIAATGTGTASQDDALAFPNQVRKVALFNNSSQAIPFEFDQTSTANSWPLQAGQILIFDNVFCTVVHVFPSATLSINAPGGLYVKGWK